MLLLIPSSNPNTLYLNPLKENNCPKILMSIRSHHPMVASCLTIIKVVSQVIKPKHKHKVI